MRELSVEETVWVCGGGTVEFPGFAPASPLGTLQTPNGVVETPGHSPKPKAVMGNPPS